MPAVAHIAAAGALCIALANCRPGPVEPPTGLLISNLRVFDTSSGTFSDPMGVLLRDGRIASMGAPGELGEPEDQIDAGGGFALPGLWDSHVHLSPLSLSGADSLKTELARFVQSGVLYVRDLGGPLEVVASMRDQVSAGTLVGPDIYFSGPLAERPPLEWRHLNEKLPGFTVPIESESQVDSLIGSVAGAGGSFLKVFGKWDRRLFHELVRRAEKAGLQVVVDPGPPFFQDISIDTALGAGVTSIEHAHSAWRSALRPDLQATHDRLAAGRDMAARGAFFSRVVPLGLESIDLEALRALGDRLNAAGAYFCPTLRVAEAWRTAPPPFPDLPTVEDRLRFWNHFADVAARITQELAGRGVRLLVGHDGMDSSGTVQEMELLVERGVSPADVLRAATTHPARWMRQEDDAGSLAAGMRADLVIVDGDPLRDMSTLRSPVLVIQSGTVRHKAASFEAANLR